MNDKCECPARKALRELATCGFTDIDPRIKYMEVQVSRGEWAEAQAALSAPCPCEQLRAENAKLRQQALSRAAEVVQMLAVVREAGRMMASHPSWCRPEPKPGLGCACGLADLRNAIADYQDSLQGRQA